MEKRKNLIYKIAKEYYEKNQTQQSIAKQFGISRIMVSRLLQKALNEKIVEIKIYEPDDPNLEYERLIEQKYGLNEVVVVTPEDNTYQNTIQAIGTAAADYFLRNLQGNEKVSISWGETLMKFTENLPVTNNPFIQIIQMIGGLGSPSYEISGTELTRQLANKMCAKPWMLNSPGIVQSKELRNALIKEPIIRSTLDLARKSDVCIVGLGQFSENSILQKTDSILTGSDIERLKKLGAVGDVSLQFFDKEGNILRTEIQERVVGLNANELASIPRIIGIAGGESKLTTIKAALKGKLINVLITDSHTAKNLLNQ